MVKRDEANPILLNLSTKQQKEKPLEIIIEYLKKHALAHYNEDGWDFLVECYDDDEIEEILIEDKVKGLGDAIKCFSRFLKVKNELRREIESEAW